MLQPGKSSRGVLSHPPTPKLLPLHHGPLPLPVEDIEKDESRPWRRWQKSEPSQHRWLHGVPAGGCKLGAPAQVDARRSTCSAERSRLSHLGTDSRTSLIRERHSNKTSDRHTNMARDRHTNITGDRHTNMARDRHTNITSDRHTNKTSDRHTCKHD